MADESSNAVGHYSSSSSGGGTSIWMWVGIGCGTVLLGGAAALIFGGYKSYSCCKEAVERQKAARQTAMAFAVDLRDSNYESAWGRTTEAFREGYSRKEFRNTVEEYRDRVGGSVPELVGFRTPAGREEGKSERWELDVGFRPHAGETYVVMRIRLAEQKPDGKPEFLVDEMNLEEREREVNAEPAARRVRRFNRLLEEGSEELARGIAASGFEPASSEEKFRTYVQGEGAVHGASGLEIRSIRYERGREATVYATHEGPDGESVDVRYSMVKSGAFWKIAGVEVGVESSASGRGTDGGDPDGETSRDAGGDVDREGD